ncbi:MAG: hypothetical protein A2133_05185 [Actinobacteria bacterium RBG_16_64_13]|nr:MAG: hypothetical protein A2133_05185 [Actinobacteria bacterium RBG_16_64_13]
MVVARCLGYEQSRDPQQLDRAQTGTSGYGLGAVSQTRDGLDQPVGRAGLKIWGESPLVLRCRGQTLRSPAEANTADLLRVPDSRDQTHRGHTMGTWCSPCPNLHPRTMDGTFTPAEHSSSWQGQGLKGTMVGTEPERQTGAPTYNQTVLAS